MILILLTFGWFYLTAVDYHSLSKNAISSLGFFSNLYYLSESGYFDVSSHKKWLLHTWSLSVEWQFYLIYPILLSIAFNYYSKKIVKTLIVTLCLISFIFCVYLTAIYPEGSFYIFPTRAWEMMVGGISFLFPLTLTLKRKKVFEVMGMVMILFACFYISNDDLWPGYLTLFPVVGTYLIIVSERHQSRITGNLVMQYIGKYSYSIYLWHWPIVLVFVYWGLTTNQYLILGMLLSLIAGYLSYVFIESRSSFKINTLNIYNAVTYPPILITVIICSICLVIYQYKGFPSRIDARVVVAANETNNRSSLSQCKPKTENKITHCIIGNKDNITGIVLGDSHAKALSTSIAQSMNTNTKGLLIISSNACPFILKAKITAKEHCFDTNNTTLELIEKSYPEIPIYIINRTSFYIYGNTNPSRRKSDKNSPRIYFDSQYEAITDNIFIEFERNYINSMCHLAQKNTVYVTTPVPEMLVNVPEFMSKRMLIQNDFSDYSTSLHEHLKRNTFALNVIKKTESSCNINILNTEEYLCFDDRCKGSIGGRPIYFDGDHLSEFGNKLLTPMFEKVIDKY